MMWSFGVVSYLVDRIWGPLVWFSMNMPWMMSCGVFGSWMSVWVFWRNWVIMVCCSLL